MGKYNSYTAEFKVKEIKFTEQNGNCAAKMEFSVNKAHIHYWHKQKLLCKGKQSVRTVRGHKTQKCLQHVEKLFQYFKEKRNNGNAVFHEMLQL